MRIVAKFGGISLASGEKIVRAAKAIAKEVEKGKEVAIVVSAIEEETDRLINLIKNISNKQKLSDRDKDDIVGMGERTSTRVFSATLKSLGIDSIALDPQNPLWPILTDTTYGEANILLEDSRSIANRKIIPLIRQGKVPVISGFLGLAPNGAVTTLGRGGSDITATALGNMIDANQVIIVKDVDGVLSCDPRRVEKPKILEKITLEEMKILSVSGAKVIHPRALEYVIPGMTLRIVNDKYGDLFAKGTEIICEEEEKKMGEVAQVTLVGSEKFRDVETIEKILSTLRREDIQIYGMLTTKGALAILIDKEKEKNVCNILHSLTTKDPSLKAVSVLDEKMQEFISKDMKWLDLSNLVMKTARRKR